MPATAVQDAEDAFRKAWHDYFRLYLKGRRLFADEQKKITDYVTREKRRLENEEKRINQKIDDKNNVLLVKQSTNEDIGASHRRNAEDTMHLLKRLEEGDHLLMEIKVNRLTAGLYYLLKSQLQDRSAIFEKTNELLATLRTNNLYQLCFGLMMLLEDGDELMWIYGIGDFAAKVIALRLPWAKQFYLIPEDLDIFEKEIKGDHPFQGSLYWQMTYEAGEDDGHDIYTLDQILYRISGGILPDRADDWKTIENEIVDYGIDPKSDIAKVLYYCAVLIQESETRYNAGIRTYTLRIQEDDQRDEESLATLKDKNKKLKEENEKLSNSLHSAAVKNRKLEEHIQSLQKQLREEKDELAGLREVIFTREHEEETKYTSKVSFPYHVKKHTIVIGGQESWRKPMHDYLQGSIRFVDRDKSFGDSYLNSAEDIWIQTNCLDHSTYYRVVDIAKKRRIPLYFFACSGARRCAEQFVDVNSHD